jgi:hypothetical protein
MAAMHFHPDGRHTKAIEDVAAALLEKINERSRLKNPPQLDRSKYAARLLELHLGETSDISRPTTPDPFSVLLGCVLEKTYTTLRGGTK